MLTYLTVLSFYLHLRSSPHYASQPHLLKNHPIMGRLLTLKQGLSTLEDLNFAAGGGDRDDSDEDGDEIKAMRKEQLWGEGLGGLALERGELEELLKESENWGEDSVTVEPGTPQKAEKKTKKKKKSKSQESSKPLYDLVEPAFISSHASSSALSSTEDDAFGDPLALSHTDQTDKATRRKSLKFHTSKIESASRKKEGKRKNIVGGDDDIPWEKRDKEKEKETKKRGELGMGGDDLEMEGEEVQEKRGKRSREELDDEEGGVAEEDDEGYYDLVRKQKKAKKEEKKEAYEAEREAQRLVIFPTPPLTITYHRCLLRIDPVTLSTSDPRSITRAIMKNKGLTPHRSKSVRNPRVKKRMKFEEAKKKVASKKAVYKGGLEASGGRYEGEKTGISTKVKSVRLG
jgi:U3 small nucleolar RNA-associated protein 3